VTHRDPFIDIPPTVHLRRQGNKEHLFGIAPRKVSQKNLEGTALQDFGHPTDFAAASGVGRETDFYPKVI
jgi:hypothetical protein